MRAVIDTNVLVSALLSPHGTPAKILDLVLNDEVTPCFDSRILLEYDAVLARPKFHIEEADRMAIMAFLRQTGLSVVPVPLPCTFVDEADKKFYEVAKHCKVKLITGNAKHFPDDPRVIYSPAQFYDWYMSSPYESNIQG